MFCLLFVRNVARGVGASAWFGAKRSDSSVRAAGARPRTLSSERQPPSARGSASGSNGSFRRARETQLRARSAAAGQFAHTLAERLERAHVGVELRVFAPRVVDRRGIVGFERAVGVEREQRAR